LFVDFIAEHIHPTHGRAGIIVPEGIIFQSAGAYKDLRKMLVDKAFLYAVVSLPAGVFQPYSGVKTSILLMDKTIAAKTDKILFVKIQNDGFGLGAQRREMATSYLPDALNLICDFQQAILQGDTSRFEGEDLNLQAIAVKKTKIAENGDYNLSSDRYKENQDNRNGRWDLVDFEDLIENVKYTNKIQRSEFLESGEFSIVDQSEKFIAGYWNNEADVFKLEKPIIAFGDHTRIFKYIDFDFVLGADGIKILQPNSKIDSKFFYNVLQNIEIKSLGYSRHYKELKETKIPLPPLSIQKEISR
jgi:type I restriction enzyme M protein